MKLSAYPKAFEQQIVDAAHHHRVRLDRDGRALDADGLEMYDGFLTSLDDDYSIRWAKPFKNAGFEMPMMCCSPDFTNPDPDGRKRAVDHEVEMIRVTRRLGGPGALLPGADRPALPGGQHRAGH